MKPRVMLAVTGATLLLSAGCGLGGSSSPATVTITPANGAAGSRPDQPVVVKAAHGTLRDVTVRSAGGRVAGTYDKRHAQWTSAGTLTPATKYTVTATARNSGGKTTTATSAFQTLTPERTFGIADITPMPGETVGVGMPLIVKFSDPVYNKANVERALRVTSTRPAEGAWHWFGNQEAVYRTKDYWQPHQTVTLTARLAGVRGAQDTYGTKDYSRSFTIGDSHVSTVDVKTHRMTVTVDGRTVKTVPISAGKGGERKYTTTNGVHAVMGKQSPVTMTSGWMGVTDQSDPNYYSLTVYQAVQISSSGEYVHSAPWSVGSQGRENVSHGCVNAPPSFAKWFYDLSNRGDIVKVTGTDRELESDNGYGYWQLSWADWVKGSALR
ncbi:Ig-like domain-containing protein [Actinoallomurus spadix]|uniref:Ig-like domain-containing protein n=1 Tax=Actinoallomurus spadix TaxID=79912 RepID=A0ABN0WZN3_9ACTN|nr:Ig-like domain-containing protein [Actinoallomurus spadix]MCO5989074.1 Ig-like domain-containing protein [Actinoallomurus spadix]